MSEMCWFTYNDVDVIVKCSVELNYMIKSDSYLIDITSILETQ